MTVQEDYKLFEEWFAEAISENLCNQIDKEILEGIREDEERKDKIDSYDRAMRGI